MSGSPVKTGTPSLRVHGHEFGNLVQFCMGHAIPISRITCARAAHDGGEAAIEHSSRHPSERLVTSLSDINVL